MISKQKLLFWLDKKYNVLFEGKHGIGKSAIIIEAFNEAGIRWAYFSGATMDPFIDFVGVPVKNEIDAVEVLDANGRELEHPKPEKMPNGGDKLSVIELIRPRHIVEGDYQAIFFDEFNRAHKKIRNASMELIQFKTINGKPFSSDLRVVWAAINPEGEDTTYDVEPLDPAQKDRFIIQVSLPYECDTAYFTRKYGVQGQAALQWWRDLSLDLKNLVSPRRLDGAVQVYIDGGDLNDVLPQSTNPSKLKAVLASGPAELKLRDLMTKPDDEAKRFLTIENNYTYAITTIMGDVEFRNKFLALLPKEKIALLFSTNDEAKKHFLKSIKVLGKASPFLATLQEMAAANQNQREAKIIREELEKVGIYTAPQEIQVSYYAAATAVDAKLKNLVVMATPQTYHRRKAYQLLMRAVPEKMTDLQAWQVLEVCNKCCSAYPKTIAKDMKYMTQIQNHALLTLIRSGNTPDKIESEMKKNARFRKVLRHRNQTGAPSIAEIGRYAKKQAELKATTVTPLQYAETVK